MTPTQVCGPKCHDFGITGYGNPNDGVMFLGIAPGRQEQFSGRPMVGPSGQLIDAILDAAAWPRDRIYVSNCLCWHPTDDFGKDRDPTDEEIAECWPRVDLEIRQFRPKLIVTVGGIPTRTLFQARTHYAPTQTDKPESEHLMEMSDRLDTEIPFKSIGSTRGIVSWNDEYECYVMPTYHPAAILRGQAGFIHDIARDLNKIIHIVGDPDRGIEGWPRPDDPSLAWDYRVVESRQEALEILSSVPRLHGTVQEGLKPNAEFPLVLGPNAPIAWLDIETGAIDVDEANDTFVHPLLCFSISWDGRTAYVFPDDIIDQIGPNEWNEFTVGVLWGFWNGQSDSLGLLQAKGFNLHIDRDPMIDRSYPLDERQGVHRLKNASREYQPGCGYWEEPIKRARFEWRRDAMAALKTELEIRTRGLRATGKAGPDGLTPGYKTLHWAVPDDVRAWYTGELLRIKNAGYEVIPRPTLYRYNAEDAIRTARQDVAFKPYWRDALAHSPLPSCNVWPGRDGKDCRALIDGKVVAIDPELRTPTLEDVTRDLLVPAANVFRDITLYGVNINQTQLADLHLTWIPMYMDMEAELQELAVKCGWRSHGQELALRGGFVDRKGNILDHCPQCRDEVPNFNSSPQKNHLVYDIIHAPVLQKYGRSTQADAMEEMIGLFDPTSTDPVESARGQFFDKWSAWARLNKALSAYVMPMTAHVREDGSAHAEARLHNTVTGRLAFAKPPWGQLPKYTDADSDQFGHINLAVELRKLVEAHTLEQAVVWYERYAPTLNASLPVGQRWPDPREVAPTGYALAEFDFARIELYTGALLSKDDALLQALRSGDYHGKTARDIFGFDDTQWKSLPDDHDDPSNSQAYWRRESKYVTFGILNNRQADALAKNELKKLTGGDPRKAQVFLDRWHQMYHDYALYKEEMARVAVEEGELVSWTGRRRRFRLVLDQHALNQAINFPVQSLASDVCLSALIELHRLLRPLGGHCLFSIHDCILFELPKISLDVTLPLIVSTMERPRFPGLPSIPVDGKIGINWGATHDCYKDGEWFDYSNYI